MSFPENMPPELDLTPLDAGAQGLVEAMKQVFEQQESLLAMLQTTMQNVVIELQNARTAVEENTKQQEHAIERIDALNITIDTMQKTKDLDQDTDLSPSSKVDPREVAESLKRLGK